MSLRGVNNDHLCLIGTGGATILRPDVHQNGADVENFLCIYILCLIVYQN